jgi:16S rRNA (guanine(527)-N(7))-methyltransferase RsmG
MAGLEVDFAAGVRRGLGGVIEVSDEQCEALRLHFEILLRWSGRLNLTAIREPGEMILRHYCESVFLGAHLAENEIRVVDVGSGAGFPGVGVAALRPRAQVWLAESSQKKATFLKEATRHMANVRVLAERAEKIKERFDWQVCRGVAWEEMPRLAERLAILGSEPAPEFPWTDVIRLPWGDRRVLLIG